VASYNKVIMAGNLTRDPALSYLPNQTPVVDFGLAVNRRWTDRQTHEKREDVCFVDCRCYGKQAETVNQYMRKGRNILVEGRLEFDQWEGKDGTRRSKHRIFVERFTFLSDGQQDGQPQNGQYSPHQATVPSAQPPQGNQYTPSPPPTAPVPIDDYPPPSNDIPF
jgi:single-strand DNA-binding protein